MNNIVLNKNITHLLKNFDYFNKPDDIIKCNNLIWVIQNEDHMHQMLYIKNIKYNKIFIIINVKNITNIEQKYIETILKKNFDNINLFYKNNLNDWNSILDTIIKNLKKGSLTDNFYTNTSFSLILIILIFFLLIISISIIVEKNNQLKHADILVIKHKANLNGCLLDKIELRRNYYDVNNDCKKKIHDTKIKIDALEYMIKNLSNNTKNHNI